MQPPLTKESNVFTQDMHILDFTIIATDGALFRTPLHNISQFSLAAAQRLELLVKFGKIPMAISHLYVVCQDAEATSHFVVKYAFKVSKIPVANKYPDPTSYLSLETPFFNLQTIPNSSIVQSRMRALFARPIQTTFSVNLHPIFQLGASQNPKIGTIQDWFIINTVSQSHPIHVHLINFQVVQQLSLKIIPEGFTLYELDFFRQSEIALFQIEDSAELCNYLNNITIEILDPLWGRFSQKWLQNQTYMTDIGLVSGKNVLEKIQNSTTNQSKYFIQGCPLGSIYKYICADTSPEIYPWYRHWKDVAEMKAYTVTRMRIRWAKNSYNSTQSAYPYFNYGEDELMEFPGMVYHCHILPHEENMMMRPIMLQPSDAYLALTGNASSGANNCTSGGSWGENEQCINQALGC